MLIWGFKNDIQIQIYKFKFIAAAASEPEASEQGSRSKFCFVGRNQNFLFGALHDGTSESSQIFFYGNP